MINGHAKWSPSGSPRWLKCSASVTLGPGEDSTSPAAERGTYLHNLAAEILENGMPDGTEREDLEPIQEYVAYLTAEMDDFNNQVHIEVDVPLTPVTGEAGATGAIDALVVHDNLLRVVDLKTGAVEVDPSSSQLMIYGAACCYEIGHDGPVHLIIHQGGWARVHETHSETLLAYAAGVHQYVSTAESKAKKGEHLYSPGEDQCRYCPHIADCKVLREYRDELAATDFQVDAQITEHDLGMIPPLKAWIKAVEERALRQALDGHTPPGYKLVRANTMRKWVGEQELVAVLGDAAYSRKLIGIGAGEKLLDAETMNELTTKPEGSPVLVPESDKRQPITTDAADDFKDA